MLPSPIAARSLHCAVNASPNRRVRKSFLNPITIAGLRHSHTPPTTPPPRRALLPGVSAPLALAHSVIALASSHAALVWTESSHTTLVPATAGIAALLASTVIQRRSHVHRANLGRILPRALQELAALRLIDEARKEAAPKDVQRPSAGAKKTALRRDKQPSGILAESSSSSSGTILLPPVQVLIRAPLSPPSASLVAQPSPLRRILGISGSSEVRTTFTMSGLLVEAVGTLDRSRGGRTGEKEHEQEQAKKGTKRVVRLNRVTVSGGLSRSSDGPSSEPLTLGCGDNGGRKYEAAVVY
ncbi:hypothetical protein M427DRAFT_28968 [Gonapodya prolifera JEL478]|uniref:Uncharacterized protein n=1 Tax=Gonapodya prolifera (strain JEL478) TaxID=1344416 RepID=A0A139AS07_GONPJ|nr:hypothetical protein M427DRAFT_28968 [Gonapodya prolifera JEL478]|eukprot:KXS19522.1 hypothetical protein M427DRAFT_28968 [Gonapodya prolifera JEL478]